MFVRNLLLPMLVLSYAFIFCCSFKSKVPSRPPILIPPHQPLAQNALSYLTVLETGVEPISKELTISFLNYSKHAVPETNDIEVIVSIDESIVDIRSLSAYKNAYPNLYASNVITLAKTGIFPKGKKRVSVRLASKTFQDRNYKQKIKTRRLTFPNDAGLDLKITGAGMDDQSHVFLLVKNIGSIINRTMTGNFKLLINERDSILGNVVIPVMLPNSEIKVYPVTNFLISNKRIKVSEHQSYRLSLFTSIPDVDRTNNFKDGIFNKPRIATGVYQNLLSNSKIFRNLNWNEEGLVVNYTNWSDAQKKNLLDAIERLEKNQSEKLASPPILTLSAPNQRLNVWGEITKHDAWDIYIARVAQTLWYEANFGAKTWSILRYNDQQLRPLLDFNHIMKFINLTTVKAYELSNHMGSTFDWSPKFGYDFLKNHKLIGYNKISTIHNVTEWIQGNFDHFHNDSNRSNQDDWRANWQSDQLPSPQDKIYGIPGAANYMHGCGGVAGVYRALLHSINIPVLTGIDTETYRTKYGHRAPFFPTERIGMFHGDDVYFLNLGMLIGSHGRHPSAELFKPSPELESFFAVDRGNQFSYLDVMNKLYYLMAFEYRYPYILKGYIHYRVNNQANIAFHADFQEIGMGNYVQTPTFTRTIAQLEAEIKQIASEQGAPPHRPDSTVKDFIERHVNGFTAIKNGTMNSTLLRPWL